MINSCVLAGNLTREAELRQTQGGTNILNFGIAVNERVKNNQTGEWEDRPNFFDCVCFGRRAESLSRILAKGMKVTVSGHLRYSSWETKDGGKRSKVEVVVDDLEFMQRRDGARAQQQGYQQPQQTYGQPQQYATQGYQGGYQQQGYQQPQQGYQGGYQDQLYDEEAPF